jgi:voltage-gated potassium channel
MRKSINRFFERWEAPWEIFMIALALAFVAIGFLPEWTDLSARSMDSLATIDIAITVFFILEFVVRFSASYSRSRYLKSHWLDLLAIIPLVRWIRVARLVRIIRILRLLRIGRIIDSLDSLGVDFAHFAKLNGLQWMLLASTAAMLGVSILFYYAESPTNPEVSSFWDAFYASVLTWASAGYGDIRPVTDLGRICGLVLIISGLTTWGLVIGNLSAFFTSRTRGQNGEGPIRPDKVDEGKPPG